MASAVKGQPSADVGSEDLGVACQDSKQESLGLVAWGFEALPTFMQVYHHGRFSLWLAARNPPPAEGMASRNLGAMTQTLSSWAAWSDGNRKPKMKWHWMFYTFQPFACGLPDILPIGPIRYL